MDCHMSALQMLLWTLFLIRTSGVQYCPGRGLFLDSPSLPNLCSLGLCQLIFLRFPSVQGPSFKVLESGKGKVRNWKGC